MCQSLVEDRDYQTLAHLIRVNKQIHGICQKMLDQVKRSIHVIEYRYGQGDDEYVLFPFVITDAELPLLEAELKTYDDWIKSQGLNRYEFSIGMFENGRVIDLLQLPEEQIRKADQLQYVIENRDNIDEIWTGAEEYHGGLLGFGYGTMLPLTRKLVNQGIVEF